MILRGIVRMFVVLNSNKGEGEIALGIAFGFLLALVPAGNLLWPLLFVLTLFARANLAVELLFLGLFKLVVPLADPLLDRLGLALLTAPALYDPLTALYNVPVVPFTRFNNSLVAGGLVAGLLLLVPVFFGSRALVGLYRTGVKQRIEESRLFKAIKKLPLVSRITTMAAEARRVYRIAG